ncbi:hypothetical protein EC988_007944, partial [Linderina pennispora]
LKSASIRTVAMVVMEAPNVLRDEITTTVVPLMLDALQTSKANTVDVRRAALETLALVPEKYDIGVLHSVRHTILKVLTKARDDHKRLVRLDAVRGYNKWLNFGDV